MEITYYSMQEYVGVFRVIKGYEGMVTRCGLEGRRLRRTAKLSLGARFKKKLLSKSTWFKGAGIEKDWYKDSIKGANSGRSGHEVRNENRGMEPKTVLFIEYSKECPGLAKKRTIQIYDFKNNKNIGY